MNNKQALQKISALTECDQCPDSKVNCCHDIHCAEVVKNYPHVNFQEGNNPKGRFLLEDGCSVPAHCRPLCSVHTCDGEKFLVQSFKEEYDNLMEIIVNENNKTIEGGDRRERDIRRSIGGEHTFCPDPRAAVEK
jgi:hypothetical protein